MIMKLINATPEFYNRKGVHIRTEPEAWGHRIFSRLTVPLGSTAQEYRDRLALCVRCTYPRFIVEGESVIEEALCSIGD